ncbi:unnamed protein product, partial [Lymnaea stagnalis]
GYKRFTEDVLLMVGDVRSTRIIFYAYYIWNWIFFAPVLILVSVSIICVQYEPIIDEHYPDWAEALGWLIVAAVMIWTPAWYIIKFLVEWKKNNFRKGWKV